MSHCDEPFENWCILLFVKPEKKAAEDGRFRSLIEERISRSDEDLPFFFHRKAKNTGMLVLQNLRLCLIYVKSMPWSKDVNTVEVLLIPDLDPWKSW